MSRATWPQQPNKNQGRHSDSDSKAVNLQHRRLKTVREIVETLNIK